MTRRHAGSRQASSCVLVLVSLLASAAPAADLGTVWEPGGITAQQDGANFAVLPLSDTLALLYTRVAPGSTQLRVFRSGDSGQSVVLAQDAIATGRSTSLNPNTALALASGQTLLGGMAQGTEGAAPEAPWLRGTGQTWSTPTVNGLPNIGPAAHPFPSPFPASPAGFLRAVVVAANGPTVLSAVDNNSANPPVLCRSVDQAVSFTCAPLPVGAGTIRWRDPASGSTSAPGTTQPLAVPSVGRWLAMDSLAQVYRSFDDGQTWTLVTRLTTDASVSWAITCLPPSTTCIALTSSYAAGTNRLFRSTDGGGTWSAAFTAPRGDLLTTLVAAGGNTVLALGDPSSRAPVLYGLQSPDGGVTWVPILSPRKALWAGSGQASAQAANTDYMTGFEEISELLTVFSTGAEPTGSLTTPRAVGPGRSIQSAGDFGSFGGFTHNFTNVCTSDCLISARWYTRFSTLVCAASSVLLVSRMMEFLGTSMQAGVGYDCASAGVFSVTPRIALTTDPFVPLMLGTATLTTDIWYRFEYSYQRIGLTARRFTLSAFVEDSPFAFDTITLSLPTGASTATGVLLGSSLDTTLTLVWKFDDLGYRLVGPPLAGPAAIWTVPPTSDVSVQWSPAAANQFAHVDDVPGIPDDGADTVTSATSGQIDRFAVSGLTGVPLGWNPGRALVNFRIGPGSSSPNTAGRAWDAFGAALVGPNATLTGSFASAAFKSAVLAIAPNGAETADIARWNIGYERTTAGGTVAMTAVWLSVELSPDPGAGGGGDSALGDGPSPFWTMLRPYVRADGSVWVWAFWSDVLAASTPSYAQAFNSLPLTDAPTDLPIPIPNDGRLVVGPAPGRVTIPHDDVTVTTTATVVLAANSLRIRGTCHNHGPNAVRIGDPTTTATKGVRLAPGRSFTSTAVASVYAVTEAATATVSCTEDVP